MKPAATRLPSWIAGIAIAFAGVALARLVAPALAGPAQIATVVGGETLSFAGLLVICLGIRARTRRHPIDAAIASSSTQRP